MFKKDDMDKDVEDVVIEEPKVHWEMTPTTDGDYLLSRVASLYTHNGEFLEDAMDVTRVKSPSDARKAIKNYNRDTIKLDDNGQQIHD